jgi:non-ribosomal peptide synthetase-like protein
MGSVPAGEQWAGAPGTGQGEADLSRHATRPPRTRRWVAIYGISGLLLSLVPMIAAVPGLAVLAGFARGAPNAWMELAAALRGVPLATVAAMGTFALIILGCVRLLSLGLRAGSYPMHSRQAWQAWATVRLTSLARVWLYPLYASMFTAFWLRALGARVGRDAELSTVVALPAMTSVGDGAFLADDTMVAPYELAAGRLRIDHVYIGERSFLGNSGITAPGRDLPERGLVGVQSITPQTAEAGSSYFGIPPVELPRTAEAADRRRTYEPPLRLKLARALVEVSRLVPAMCTVAVAVLVAAVFEGLAASYGFAVAALSGGLALLGAGVLAAMITTVVKWALVGRISTRSTPLWSSFVWRNELADNFVEVLAVPWFARPWLGTAPLNLWLRSLGARVGRGVWTETYWLPETDLVRLGDGSCVNRGCVLQTHLFHDRVLSIGEVELAEGATLGPNGIVLPAMVGAHATIGPASLVIRGETVPPWTRWIGNPIVAWSPGPSGR